MRTIGMTDGRIDWHDKAKSRFHEFCKRANKWLQYFRDSELVCLFSVVLCVTCQCCARKCWPTSCVCVCVWARARSSTQTHVPQPLGPILLIDWRHFNLRRGLFIYCLNLWNSLLTVIKLWSRRSPNHTELSVSAHVRHVRT